MQPALTDGTVTLTPLGPADYDAHLAGEDAELVRWLSGGPSTPEGLRAYLELCERWWREGGPMHHFGIRVDAVLTGTMDVQTGQPYLAPAQANLAYGLYPAWRGRGLASRAVELACCYATGLGCAEAVIRCDPANRPSAAVAHRTGFTFRQRRSEPDGSLLDWYIRAL